MMEAASTSEMLINFYQATWLNNPEDSHLHILDFSWKDPGNHEKWHISPWPRVTLLLHRTVQST
jgi:hypothetical protein